MNKIKHINLILFLVFNLYSYSGFTQETCSRVAMINYQEVLVDSSSSNKGEGLKYYLNRDPISKKYLTQYQEKNKPNWYSTFIGTSGTLLVIYGTFQSSTPTFNKNTLIYSGASLLFLNYLIAKTNEHNNEHLLNKSINEYNKRNLPRIYFNPIVSQKRFGVYGGILQDF